MWQYTVSIITNNSNSTNKVPKNFNAIIPSGTKVLSLKVEEDKVTVDFSKEILGVSSILEEKMIESIIYTLTSEENIKKNFRCLLIFSL